MRVTLIAAISADGLIARLENERSFDWTSQADKNFYLQAVKQAKVVIMGRKSFQTFNRYPKGVRYVIYSSQPENFVNPKPQVIKAEATNDQPTVLISKLAEQGFQEVLIAGGATIYTLFMKAGIVDRIFLTVEPIFFGQGVKLFNQTLNQRWQLINISKLGEAGTVLLEYKKK